MNILVFGLESEDAILSRLRRNFPNLGFKKYQISMELEDEGKRIVAIDTVKGIDHVMLLDDMSIVSPAKAMSGSGAIMTLRILLKIGSLESAKVIAVPEKYPQAAAVQEISNLLSQIL
ncbi:MAG: hypothetical protein AB1295_01535 [Candidatus Micrarchaeota archaeon]